ncbi:MAG: Maf family protein [Gammaproteobacteria bacterium]
MPAQIILASASPRRMELMDQIKVSYTVAYTTIDELPKLDETPLDYVCRMAAEKSAACPLQYDQTGLPVLAADTAVVFDGIIMGKPADRVDAIAMLKRLSGKTHRVYSAVSLRGRQHDQAVSITDVTFRPLTECEMLAYWQSGEPADKAGAYAIQGLGGIFVESVRGSFSGVVGLPLFETAELLSRQGIKLFK